MPRGDEPAPVLIQSLVSQVFPCAEDALVERVAEGISTSVYRIRRGMETFYLRVLPEAGASFAPEVRAHALLRARGVAVPVVIYFEHCHPALRRAWKPSTPPTGTSSTSTWNRTWRSSANGY